MLSPTFQPVFALKNLLLPVMAISRSALHSVWDDLILLDHFLSMK
ncbi:MAG: hypothetical protein ABIR00_07175 [Nitrosospira sp.]